MTALRCTGSHDFAARFWRNRICFRKRRLNTGANPRFAPSGLTSLSPLIPRLTPWATTCRRSAARTMAPSELMHAIDTQLAHVWMVRAFLKHSDEAAEDDELAEVHRELYDYMLALGGPLKENNAEEYLRMARKKLGRLKRARDSFATIQPEISRSE